ncbi:toll/interleukin-1 receptor domain-containing protein [Candidatus Venteria ishoeyi]|uniref:TIR domain-containing protein n=1 Tax=Candidatus Venteria ishoeyi TaxID=1899563 RepID=A0A1H6FHX7_9GAMM|nr:toll/interleukin-1 receptor domain-containing protein [Candidatus Venteria ishoeyi]MDM8547890.1 toll/interleukin-1 receptor domain-containing protein [Candidatus Venteria ishoeyi]SEH08979.1 Uncharacterised protein [Candidatus Venteria ishoeyi]
MSAAITTVSPLSLTDTPTATDSLHLNKTKSTHSGVSLFYSYSHEDEAYRQYLEKHLKLLQRMGIIRVWHDRMIEAGMLWETDIKQQLESAQIILLLISPDFLFSDYCYDIEMKRALQRHHAGTARVVPIALRPVDSTDAPFMVLQGLPTGFKPVTEWANQDRAFVNIAQGIRQLARQIQQPNHNRPR